MNTNFVAVLVRGQISGLLPAEALKHEFEGVAWIPRISLSLSLFLRERRAARKRHRVAYHIHTHTYVTSTRVHPSLPRREELSRAVVQFSCFEICRPRVIFNLASDPRSFVSTRGCAMKTSAGALRKIIRHKIARRRAASKCHRFDRIQA